MRAVDTNLLVRLVVRDDVEQVAVAEEFVARGGWVTFDRELGKLPDVEKL